jgi:hypothetical protein
MRERCDGLMDWWIGGLVDWWIDGPPSSDSGAASVIISLCHI